MPSRGEGRGRKKTNDQNVSVLTVAEVADLLHVSTETVRRWIRAGDLPALHIGRTIRIRGDDITDRLADGHQETDEE